MKLPISLQLHTLAKACSFPLYVVGGTVRDALAGLKRKDSDIDICAPASADEFRAAAESLGAHISAVYRNTGTVKLSLEGEEYEFASFRSDEYVRGIHTPVNTFFTDDILLDAKRRDFKCNAVYYDIRAEKFCDPLGGIDDINKRLLTTVTDPDKVFSEDGLRLMRLARQSAQLNFTPSDECLEGARKNSSLICDVSAERVYAELDAILHADGAYGALGGQYRGLKILDEIGVLQFILPELTLGKGMGQNEKFHSHDVLEHSFKAVLYADKDIRLAALLHDIGKPYCMLKYGKFYGHEIEGERIAKEVCQRLKVPKKLTEEVALLCALHMYDLKCDARENKIRKFIVKNHSIYEKLLMIKQADFSACKDDLGEAPCVTKWRKIYGKMIEEGVPLSIKQLKVRGDELISEGIKPEKAGEILNLLLYDCVLDPSLNDKKTLINRALKACEGH